MPQNSVQSKPGAWAYIRVYLKITYGMMQRRVARLEHACAGTSRKCVTGSGARPRMLPAADPGDRAGRVAWPESPSCFLLDKARSSCFLLGRGGVTGADRGTRRAACVHGTWPGLWTCYDHGRGMATASATISSRK